MEHKAEHYPVSSIYLCLQQITQVLGRKHSFLKPEWLTRIFITADIVCLVIQAVGGGLAFSSSSDTSGLGPNSENGIHIIVVGLAVQILSLAFFLMLFVSILARAASSRRDAAARAKAAETTTVLPTRFKVFVVVLLVVSLCIMTRCIYRVVEFSGGLNSPLAENEGLFIGLDNVMVAVAFVGLVACHPAIFLER
jgi:RTA1 like protein